MNTAMGNDEDSRVPSALLVHYSVKHVQLLLFQQVDVHCDITAQIARCGDFIT